MSRTERVSVAINWLFLTAEHAWDKRSNVIRRFDQAARIAKMMLCEEKFVSEPEGA